MRRRTGRTADSVMQKTSHTTSQDRRMTAARFRAIVAARPKAGPAPPQPTEKGGRSSGADASNARRLRRRAASCATRVFVEEQGFRERVRRHRPPTQRTVHRDAARRRTRSRAARGRIPDPDEPAGLGRSPRCGQDGADARACWVFGRLAVLPDKRAAKRARQPLLLAEAERLARQSRRRRDALARAVPRRTGSTSVRGLPSQYGPVELDEHVEHVWMRKAL